MYLHLMRLLVFLFVLCAASVLFLAVISSKQHLKHVIGNTSTYLDHAVLSSIPAAWVREHYTRQAFDRIRYLNESGNTMSYGSIYNVLVPEVRCPDLVRVGVVNDGGKYVCNPKAFPSENCSIYSLGLNDEVSFDVEIQQMTGCQIYGYDSNEQNEVTKMKYGNISGILGVALISRQTDDVGTTIEDLFRKNADDSAEVLKMDIEGAEHVTIVPFLTKHKVCQILLEIHGEPSEHLNLLISIAKLGYALFSYEVNGYSIMACEYSFIHVDCMKRHGAFELKRFLHKVTL